MLRKSDGSVDKSRYDIIWERAMRDMSDVFNASRQVREDGTETTYRKFVNLYPGRLPPGLVGLRRTKDLVTAILLKMGYSVRFVRFGPTEYLPKGFVSWLLVAFNQKSMTILYSPERMRRLASSSRSQTESETGRDALEEDKLLTKIFLHECAHGILHLDEFEKRAKQSKSRKVRLDPDHEQDAWLYALLVWGILVGDRSRDTRTLQVGGDLGWILA